MPREIFREKEDIKPFTKESCSCPKCGGWAKRVYCNGSRPGDRFWPDLCDEEFLLNHCQACHYEWPQKIA